VIDQTLEYLGIKPDQESKDEDQATLAKAD
jgi:hypothetical protein